MVFVTTGYWHGLELGTPVAPHRMLGLGIPPSFLCISGNQSFPWISSSVV